MNVVIVIGHPRSDSFCNTLASAYAEGARLAGAQVRCLNLGDLEFDLNVRTHSPRDQPLEPDLQWAQECLRWADHWVFLFPNWWGNMPAILKGFLDRVLLPGFAFNEREGGYEGLLRGKTAHLMVTMDTPPWVYRLILKQPGVQALKSATLQFCGIEPVRRSLFGVVKGASDERKQQWIEQARREGKRLQSGVPVGGEKLVLKAQAWFRAVRLQFYPSAWVTYTLGALLAIRVTGELNRSAYWLGYLFLFLLEAGTVLLNDYFDFQTDARNANYSPFSGGSRVLVERRLSFAEMRQGIAVVLALCLLCAGGLLLVSTSCLLPLVALLVVAIIITLGYTAPPLQLAYRVSAELDVCLTHSFLLVLCGWMFQGGAWHTPLPWLVSVPLFLAGFPSIALSSIPDCEADCLVNKSTFAVRWGPRRTLQLAALFTAVAAISAVLWQAAGLGNGIFQGVAYWIVPHAFLLLWMLARHLRAGKVTGRIDGLMVTSLSFMLPFAVLPLWRIWRLLR